MGVSTSCASSLIQANENHFENKVKEATTMCIPQQLCTRSARRLIYRRRVSQRLRIQHKEKKETRNAGRKEKITRIHQRVVGQGIIARRFVYYHRIQ